MHQICARKLTVGTEGSLFSLTVCPFGNVSCCSLGSTKEREVPPPGREHAAASVEWEPSGGEQENLARRM